MPFPIEQVFGFFANPENLPRIMPAWQKTHLESAKLTTPNDMPHLDHTVAGAGSELLISFRPVPFVPVRQSWRALIDDFQYLSHFCDTQLSGPFAYWHHCHRFRGEQHGSIQGTIVRDELEYELPLAGLSDAANGLISVNLSGVFRYRQTETIRILQKEAERTP